MHLSTHNDLNLSMSLSIKPWQSASYYLPITVGLHTNLPYRMTATDRVEFNDVIASYFRVFFSITIYKTAYNLTVSQI